MQVHRCVGFSQIPDFTENWNNPHSSLLCSERSETPCPWDKSHQTWHWAGSRPKTALWVHPISWSPEGDSNECFLEVALGKNLIGFFQTPLPSRPRWSTEMWRTVESTFLIPLETKSQDVDLPASTLGDTMPASGDPRVYQRCHFTGNSGNEIHFPQVNKYMGFERGPFLGSHIGNILRYPT